MIGNVLDVWANGMVTPHGMQLEEKIRLLNATDAGRIERLRWTHEGSVYEVPRGSEPLPDRTGIAVLPDRPVAGSQGPCRRLDILNADGSLRLLVEPPELPGASMLPSDTATWLGFRTDLDGWPEPHFRAALAVEAFYIVKSDNPAFNGWPARVLLEFDWNTGALKQWARMSERY
jgi:hypothetical protein